MPVVPIVSNLVGARLLQHLGEPVLSFTLIDELKERQPSPDLPSIIGQKAPVRNSKQNRREKKWILCICATGQRRMAKLRVAFLRAN